MPDDTPFQELIRRVRAGDEAAAAEVVRRYEPTIRRVARLRLADTRLRRLFDSMDICQSVFGSFFVRAALGQFDLDSPDQLLKLLVSMSRRKLIDHVRAEGAARRDYRRTGPGGRAVPAPAAGPGREVAARELLREFRRRLAPDERELAEQRAQGRGWSQIAAEYGGSADALRKKLHRALDRVAAELGLEEAGDE
jgi:RNA polymerase sigma-70 factor (ECF subfamily)